MGTQPQPFPSCPKWPHSMPWNRETFQVKLLSSESAPLSEADASDESVQGPNCRRNSFRYFCVQHGRSPVVSNTLRPGKCKTPKWTGNCNKRMKINCLRTQASGNTTRLDCFFLRTRCRSQKSSDHRYSHRISSRKGSKSHRIAGHNCEQCHCKAHIMDSYTSYSIILQENNEISNAPIRALIQMPPFFPSQRMPEYASYLMQSKKQFCDKP